MADATQEAAIVPQRVAAAIPMTKRGVALQTFEDMVRFCKYAVASRLAPKGVDSVEAAVICLQFGMELGLTTTQALQNVMVVNGRPALWGDAVLGLCMNHAEFDFAAWKESVSGAGDNMTATCQCKRKSNPHARVQTFSVADAKRGGLWGKQGPWTNYPQRMLQMRARSWALRDEFPDVLKGIAIAEEAEDYDVKTVQSVELGAAGLAKRLEERAATVAATPDPEPQPFAQSPDFTPDEMEAIRDQERREYEAASANGGELPGMETATATATKARKKGEAF